MSQLTINIPAEHTERVLTAIAANNSYKEDIHGTQAQFARKLIIEWVKAQLRQYEGSQAAVAARDSANSSADAVPIT